MNGPDPDARGERPAPSPAPPGGDTAAADISRERLDEILDELMIRYGDVLRRLGES